MAAVSLMLLTADPGHAQLACGDTIAPGNHVVLTGDIGPCDGPGPALTVEGPAAVNLRGFKVICRAGMSGVEIIGVKATVENGSIKNCRFGLRVSGDGKHKIQDIRAWSVGATVGRKAFVVISNNNKLIHNLAQRFNGEGFLIRGEKNTLNSNRSISNKGHGFRVDGDQNELQGNLSQGNGVKNVGGEGFRVDGGSNRLKDNIARNNRRNGFHIRYGYYNRLVTNRALGNGSYKDGAGIKVQGDTNSIYESTSNDNFGEGIVLAEGATGNVIWSNSARRNGGTGLVDENLDPPCDGNRWRYNSSNSRSDRCIR